MARAEFVPAGFELDWSFYYLWQSIERRVKRETRFSRRIERRPPSSVGVEAEEDLESWKRP